MWHVLNQIPFVTEEIGVHAKVGYILCICQLNRKNAIIDIGCERKMSAPSFVEYLHRCQSNVVCIKCIYSMESQIHGIWDEIRFYSLPFSMSLLLIPTDTHKHIPSLATEVSPTMEFQIVSNYIACKYSRTC